MFTVKKSPEAAVLFRSDLWSFSENSFKFETPVILTPRIRDSYSSSVTEKPG